MHVTQTPFTIQKKQQGTSGVTARSATRTDEKRWLWVRCENEPGPLSSELVATVSPTAGSSTHSPIEAGDSALWGQTQLWCSYRAPQEVYQLIAELVQSGVVIHEVRKLSSDMRAWRLEGAVC